PNAFNGNVAGTGGASNVTFGADGGYIRYIELMLDSNADGVADQLVRFTYDKATGQITENDASGFLTGFPLTDHVLSLNASKGFAKGALVFDFLTGEYTYFTSGVAAQGDQFQIGFQVMDGDGDVATATQTIVVVDGKPV